MASKLKIAKDIQNRTLLILQGRKRRVFNIILKDLYIDLYNKVFTGESFLKNKTKIRCVLTGRSRAVQKDTRLTRMAFKMLSVNGYVPGYKKYGW